MRKRVVCSIVAVMMLLALFPTTTLFIPAAAEESKDNVFIELGEYGYSGEKYLVRFGIAVQENLPPEITYDAGKRELTLNQFKDEEHDITISSDKTVTIKLVGDNAIRRVIVDDYGYENCRLKITGDGTLNCSELRSRNFVMTSGTLNVRQNDKNRNSMGYAFYNMNYGDLEDGRKPNSFQFLGGEVNIDCSDDYEYNGVVRKQVGMDVQSGNVEIRHSKVHINLGDNEWLGLGVGWAGDKINGGTLTMENGTLEITSSDYQAYFFELKNEGDPLHYYIGTDGPEREVSFEEACPLDDIYGVRHECRSDGKGYLLITNETVETVPPVTPSPKPSDTPEKKPYVDVPKTGTWYSEAVYYATEKGYMTGTGNNRFSPKGTVTRGTIAQILYAAEGKPTVSKDKQFSDVASDQWYAKAVNWAAGKKLVAGYGGGKFGPNDPVTRQQMVAIMYQYAKMKGFDLEANADLSAFHDQKKISKWAVEPMKWAVGHRIISGITSGSKTVIEPNGTATRAQIAVILQAFDKNVRK